MRWLNLLFFLWVTMSLQAQSPICIKPYNTPVINGQTTSIEWSSHDSAMIMNSSTQELIQVRFQRNDTSLFFVFMGKLAHSSNPSFPEILIDLNYSQTNTWQIDDHWFHVSATDCHFQGDHSDFSNCQREQPDWWARRNWAMSAPDPDTVEIEIPFAKIGLDITQHDTIGIAFLVTNTINRYDFWPANADIDDPSTWGSAYFVELATTGIESSLVANHPLKLWPNPVSRTLRWEDPEATGREYRIVNLHGVLCSKGELSGAIHQVSVLDLNQGGYLLEVTHQNGTVERQRFIKQ